MTYKSENRVNSIKDFYADRSIFITGGTGFMGKVLVEKLLRSCPKIKNIYLLMRPKKGQDITSRLNELTSSPLFETIRRERPSELSKIVPILGDVTEPELGISQFDQAKIIQKVSIVFHSAATVKFDEKLKLSVSINMLGTKRLVELCLQMSKLEALVHVSTAYCNCDRAVVDEMVYPPPFEPDHIVNLVNWMGEDLLDEVTPSLIGSRPNTYTFTKALAEDMLLKECGNLPVTIVRPSIVLSSRHEPVDGWLDNLNGPTGIIAAAGKGFFRTMLCHGNKTADLVPVDTVINLMVVAAWRTATARSDGLTVYNCCTGQQKPIVWKDFVGLCFTYIRKHPFSDPVWWPGGNVRSSRLIHTVENSIYHQFPAVILDFFARVAGKPPIMQKIQDKLSKAATCLEYFATKEWKFRDDNVRRLCSYMSPTDQMKFDFDVKNIDWDSYLQSYILGIRRFIFKENPGSLPKARSQINRLHWLHCLAQVFLVLLAWRFVFMRSAHLRRLWTTSVQYLFNMARLIPLV
ncbi:putative fatty acyl-CoA reductase CG5065 [Arctopsyche grandis]|uniref:putative fatty acyl-CoA reductase CG5065 n=1 Tax=Arctopsyche grandis TaxID=121162 RepID=UPI00406D6C6F